VLAQRVQVVWCVVAAKGHVPVLMVEVETVACRCRTNLDRLRYMCIVKLDLCIVLVAISLYHSIMTVACLL